MLSPDEDGTPFTRPPGISGPVIDMAVKIEVEREREHANKTDEHEKDEQPRDVKVEENDTATKNEMDEPVTHSAPKTAEQSDTQNKTAHTDEGVNAPIEKVLYTHAHGHTCTCKNCNPIILSKRGIIRPSRPSTEHYHLGNVCSEGGVKFLSPSNQLLTPKTEELEPLKSEQTKSSEITDPKQDITQTQTVNTTTVSSHNNTQPDILPESEYHEKDEQTLEAADGLLMLQNLNPANQEATENNSVLIPLLGEEISDHEKDEQLKLPNNQTDKLDNNTLLLIPDEQLLDLEQEEHSKPLDDKASDDTIIYEPLELVTPPVNASKEESSPKKGTLTIIEVGIPKPGTSTEHVTTEAMPVITTSGKVQCDFCKRSFNTITEQKQHMARRHLAQLNKKQEELQHEKEKQKLQETKSQKENECDRKQNQEPEKDE